MLSEVDVDAGFDRFEWKEREGFPEVGRLGQYSWKVPRYGRFRYDEHITAKEARAAVWDLEYQMRDPTKHFAHHL
eukprot:5416813-Karenia_brevis.AAC.1